MPDAASQPTPTPTPPKSRSKVFAARFSSTLILWGLVTAGIFLKLNWVFFLLIGGLAMLALIECLRMFGVHHQKRYFYWTIALSLAYLASTFQFSQSNSVDDRAYFAHLDIFFFCLHLFGTLCLTFPKPLEGRKTLDLMLGSVFSFFYVIFLFNFITRVLFLPETSGSYYLLYLLAVTKFTDMGAYVVGTLCGKHKMVPHISPGKTWQGLGGAILGALLASFLMYFAFAEKIELLSLPHILILPILLGVAAVIGDLAESVLKRCLEVKDSGNMLPGIGGALDLIDSLCFTAPLLFVYMNYVLRLTQHPL